MTRSLGYARFRLASAVLFAAFGVAIFVRMFSVGGPWFGKIPGLVLGVAMVALGLVRWRDYLAFRRNGTRS